MWNVQRHLACVLVLRHRRAPCRHWGLRCLTGTGNLQRRRLLGARLRAVSGRQWRFADGGLRFSPPALSHGHRHRMEVRLESRPSAVVAEPVQKLHITIQCVTRPGLVLRQKCQKIFVSVSVSIENKPSTSATFSFSAENVNPIFGQTLHLQACIAQPSRQAISKIKQIHQ